MTNNPVLHTTTKQKLDVVQSHPPHALLLMGATGSGKKTIARWLAAKLLGIPSLENAAHYLEITSAEAGKAIGIEAIRSIEHFVSLKVASPGEVNRLIVIADAHLLTSEAQNALLKTLEEPPTGTVLILTSSQQEALLPTIRSRLQAIEVLAPPIDVLSKTLSGKLSGAKLQQVLALSGGLPGLAFALAENDEFHPLVQASTTARKLLQQSTFDRLCQVDSLAKNKQATSDMLAMLMHLAHAALLTGRSSERWQRVLRAAFNADSALHNGTQPKLALTNLMLNL